METSLHHDFSSAVAPELALRVQSVPFRTVRRAPRLAHSRRIPKPAETAAFSHVLVVGKIGAAEGIGPSTTTLRLEVFSGLLGALAALLLRQFSRGITLIAGGLLLGLEGSFARRLLGGDTRGFFGRNAFRLRGGLLSRRLLRLSDALALGLSLRACLGNGLALAAFSIIAGSSGRGAAWSFASSALRASAASLRRSWKSGLTLFLISSVLSPSLWESAVCKWKPLHPGAMPGHHDFNWATAAEGVTRW